MTASLEPARAGPSAAAALLAAAASLALVSCSSGHRQAPVRAPPVEPRVTPAPARLAPHRVRSITAGLSPAQLLGQRIVYAYAGTTPPPLLLAKVRQGEAAGVIFFGPNLVDPSAFHAALRALHVANQQSAVKEPLLLMTDEEGGLVQRLPGAPIDSEKQIGQSGDPEGLAAGAGARAGENLAAVGLNVNLAPVLDVFRTPGNFIDQDERSYGSDPRLVARLGAAFISAQQRSGVAAAAKHFPGLGAASARQDTDRLLVSLEVPAASLRADDELPYRAAIAAGVKVVLMSWATYPALDPARPAGLSPVVIGGELRARLGYRGVVITDALGADALGAFGSIGHRALLAAQAGADLLLCAEPNPDRDTPADGTASLQVLAAAYARGQISGVAAKVAAGRVLRLRASLR